MASTCTYKFRNNTTCSYEVYSPHDDQHCIFHSKSDSKNTDDFYKRFSDQRFTNEGSNGYNYEGYIFPPGFESRFKGHQCEEFANFMDTRFIVNDDTEIGFQNASFPKGVSFDKAIFLINSANCTINFTETRFSDNTDFSNISIERVGVGESDIKVDFNSSHFNNGVNFNGAKIRANEMTFQQASFTGESSSWDNTDIEADILSFKRAKLNSLTTSFDKSRIFCRQLLDFTDAEFANIFSPAKFTISRDTTFRAERISFENVYFGTAEATFGGVFFAKEISFEKLKVRSDSANFSEGVFSYEGFDESSSKIIFKDAEFYKDVNFEKAKFQSHIINFLRTKFSGAVNFSGASFDGYFIRFAEVQFSGGKVNFEATSLREPHTIFRAKSTVDFSRIRATHPVSFNAAEFTGKKILFKDAQFKDTFTFTNTTCTYEKRSHKQRIDFSNVIFYKDADFHGTKLTGEKILFNQVQFTGGSSFEDAIFNTRKVDFSGSHFTGGASNFTSTEFQGSVNFQKTYFDNGDVFFLSTLFHSSDQFPSTKVKAEFDWSIFAGGEVSFAKAQFHCSEVNFNYVQFLKGSVRFDETQFQRPIDNTVSDKEQHPQALLSFEETSFQRNLFLSSNIIEMNIIFSNIVLGPSSIVHIIAPQQMGSPSSDTVWTVTFLNTRFNPFASYFESIRLDNEQPNNENYQGLYFIFRHCHLKDVYFINSDISRFSFYGSTFDLARFSSSNWLESCEPYIGMKTGGIHKRMRYKRKNVLFDEKIIDLSDTEKKLFHIKPSDNLSFREISGLYRQMKSALDSTKDFYEAGWFYFNELEMKRRYQKHKKMHVQTFLYSLYRIFAGYGEKPQWSLLWLIIFIGIFTILNLMNGFPSADGTTVNYNISFLFDPDTLQPFTWSTWWHDISQSFVFTLFRVLPVNFLPYKPHSAIDISPWDMMVYLLNSFILLALLTLTGIGLQRHFKRF